MERSVDDPEQTALYRGQVELIRRSEARTPDNLGRTPPSPITTSPLRKSSRQDLSWEGLGAELLQTGFHSTTSTSPEGVRPTSPPGRRTSLGDKTSPMTSPAGVQAKSWSKVRRKGSYVAELQGGGGLEDSPKRAQSYTRRKTPVEMPGPSPDLIDSPLNRMPDMDELARWADGDIS